MSTFQRRCRQAHDLVQSAGLKVPYGKVQQVLARGMGHASLYDFQRSDSRAWDYAAYALLDEQGLLDRASELGVALTASLADRICLGLRDLASSPLVIRDRYFEVPAKQAFSEEHPGFDALAAHVLRVLPGHQADYPQILGAQPQSAFHQGQSWSWTCEGTSLALKDGDDYEVAFTARMEFPSVGLRLLGRPAIYDVRLSGAPEPWDPGI